MLRHAQIAAEWHDAPGSDAIRAKDRERLLAKLLAPVEIEDADRDITRQLLAERSLQDIAAMLVHAHRASLPGPEEVSANTRDDRQQGEQERHRPGFEDTVWFRMKIGRRDNADPRWWPLFLQGRRAIPRSKARCS